VRVVRGSRRAIVLVAVVCMASLALVALSARPAPADDPTTTTTEPTPDTTTTTEPIPDTTTTTLPTDDTTTTTVPTDETTTTTPPSSTTTDPGTEVRDLSPDESLVPQLVFTYLSDSQRGVLQQLQNANDTLATRRFALIRLARQVAAATDLLEAARARENEAAQREIFGLLGAALDRHDATTLARVLDPADANHLARSVTDAQAAVSLLDDPIPALARRLESERKSARRARVEAEDRVAALKASVVAQTQDATDAADAAAAAQSDAESTFGSNAVRAQADGITAALATAQAGQGDPIVVGGISLPIPGAALSSPFGVRIDPLGGGVGFHPGLDLAAGSGTPIHAAAAGVVVMAGDCGGYGSCVVIDHGSSLATVYGHQSEVLTQVGDQVDVGQVIGLVGSTGKSTGPHLHFEVRLHGMPIDPMATLIT
jgi:murein DD-endopeptidase MepM/ murein hydrolase activator NlpD